MNSKVVYALALVASIASAGVSTVVHADEAERGQTSTAVRFQGTADRAAVRAEAVQAVRAGTTSRGEIGLHSAAFEGGRSRADVKAEAVTAVRLGQTSHGEVDAM